MVGVVGFGKGIMRNRIRRPLQRTILLLTCLASGAWADSQLTLVSAGANSGMGGVYTSPYGISFTGPGGPATLMICDDFTTDIQLYQTWNAAMTTLSTITASNVSTLKFNQPAYSQPPGGPGIIGGPNNVVQDYATAAVLAAELMSLPNIGTGSEDTEAAGEYSYALWAVFDINLLTSTSTGYGTLTGAELSAAQADLAAAQAMVAAATTNGQVDLTKISINGNSINGLTVYTPTPGGASQEFLQVSMPEPSYPAVLAVDLLAVLGLIVVLRRRITGIFN